MCKMRAGVSRRTAALGLLSFAAGLAATLKSSAMANDKNPDRPVSSRAPSSRGGPPAPRMGLVGQVKSARRDKIAGVTIAAFSVGRDTPGVPELAVMTNPDGSYHWPLEPGTYDVQVIRDGRASRKRRVVVMMGTVNRLDFDDGDW